MLAEQELLLKPILLVVQLGAAAVEPPIRAWLRRRRQAAGEVSSAPRREQNLLTSPMSRLRGAAMSGIDYTDLDLRIDVVPTGQGLQGNRYIARVISSPAGEAQHEFALPFANVELENLVLKLSRGRTSKRRIHSSEMQAARDFGGQLFGAVFSGEVLACLRSSLRLSEAQDKGLRLKLRLQEVSELSNLPWEFLRDGTMDHFFAQSNRTPIVRYIEIPQPIRPLSVNLPLRLLVMVSAPRDPSVAELDTKRELKLLDKALRPLINAGKVEVTQLPCATLAELQRHLRKSQHHIFHFIGHGGFDQASQEGMLLLEDEEKRARTTSAQRIGTLLYDHRSLRLALLNSCEGARNSSSDPFAGVASTFVRQGIPAVIAMQFEISDSAAIAFASEFYSSLADGYPVDAAVAEARKAIYAQPNDVEWGTPVLFLRSASGHIFDIKQTLSPAVDTLQAAAVASPARISQSPPEKKRRQPAPGDSQRLLRASTRQRDPAPQSPVPRARRAPPVDDLATRRIGSRFETLQVVPDTADRISHAAFTANGEGVILVQGNRSVEARRIADGAQVWSAFETSDILSLATSPVGNLVAFGLSDGTIGFRRTDDGSPLRPREGHTHGVTQIAFCEDSSLFASVSYESARVWLTYERQVVATLEQTMWAHRLALSPDGRRIATLRERHAELQVWDLTGGSFVAAPSPKLKDNVVATCLCFAPDGETLAYVTAVEEQLDTSFLRTARVEDGAPLRSFPVCDGRITRIEFSPDSTLLAVVLGDSQGDASTGSKSVMQVWSVLDSTPLASADIGPADVLAIHFPRATPGLRWATAYGCVGGWGS